MIAANPGPATHIALLGIIIVIGLIVFAIVRVRHKRETAEAEMLDQTDAGSERPPARAPRRPGCRPPTQMKHALLAYDLEGSLDELATEDEAALHAAHSTLHENEATHDSVTMIAHYRFRPLPRTTTVRHGPDGPLRSDGSASTRSDPLRALYILEGEDLDAVVGFATRLPAFQHGVTFEIRPLTEPRSR